MTVAVRTAELTAALAAAKPGDVIGLADGMYAGNFTVAAQGTAERPIFLCGNSAVILDAGGITEEYVLHLDGAAWWRVLGITVRNGQKDVMADAVQHTVLQGVTVMATGDWCTISDCEPDPSNRNLVIDNTVSATMFEAIDIKEGTSGGVIAGNTFDGSALTGADSWLDLKGSDYQVLGNTGAHSPADGFQTHEMVDGGARNTFAATRAPTWPARTGREC